MHFRFQKLIYVIEISLMFVPYGPIDNKASLVQWMPWCQPEAKPLFEPGLIQFSDTYMRNTTWVRNVVPNVWNLW